MTGESANLERLRALCRGAKPFDYSAKVDGLLDGQLSGVGSFDESDFLELMMAAADQAMLSRTAQKAIRALVKADLEARGA